MSDSLISVIVPVYNSEQTLHRCIDSILGQTYRNFELLLINDGSKDRSGEICDEYARKDSRVKVELGLCKGKKLYDKRESEAERQAKRDIDRALKQH